MKNYLLVIFMFFYISEFFGQDNKNKENGNLYWNNNGKVSIIINQSSFSNWKAGGNNSFAGTIVSNYDFNYTKEYITWNSTINASYGFNRIKGNKQTKKTDDQFEINSVVGLKASKVWNYSFFTNFRSQFSLGYKDYNAEELEEISRFLSPAYLNFGPGMLWKKSDDIYINLSPASTKITFVSHRESGEYGTKKGQKQLLQIGFNLGVTYKKNLIENVIIENTLNLFSHYLNKPKNIVVNYQMNLIMKINTILSTNLNIQVISDSNSSSKVQLKEVFGLGFNISL